MIALVSSCGGPPLEPGDGTEAETFTDGNVHAMPMRTPEQLQQGARNAAGSAHLTYYGGKVVQNANVVQVVYGAGTYAAGVNSGTTNMGTFYSSVLNSAYMDWLTEYNTTSPAQTIQRGTFHGKVQITPASSRDKSTISDANIKAEISAQITAGHLPAPTNNTAAGPRLK